MTKRTYRVCSGFSILVLFAALTGCASPPAPSNAVSIESGESARFVLPITRAKGLNERNATEEFAKIAVKASRLHYFRQSYGKREGMSVNYEGARMTVGYIRESGQPLNRTHNQIANFDVTYSTQGQYKIVMVRCPNTLDVEFNNGTGLGTYPPLASREDVMRDLQSMCKRSRFVYAQLESGETNTNFGDSAVYANFARKLPAYSWADNSGVTQTDIAKYKWFTLNEAGVSLPVGITVYPYRAGSKATYKWTSSYQCHADGRCAYDIEPSRVREILNAVAND